MQAKHPIDELFHGALARAEAVPPASLFDGVMAARAKRKRGAGWWWRTGGLVLIGGALAGAVAVHLATPGPVSPVAKGQVLAEQAEVVQENTNGIPTTTDDALLAPGRPSDTTTNHSNGRYTHSGNAERTGGRDTEPKYAARTPTIPDIPNSSKDARSTVAPDFVSGPATERHGNDDRAETLAIRAVHLPLLSAGTPHSGAQDQAFVLPHGEWWVSARVAAMNETRTWSGNNTRLVEALNAAEATATYWSVGMVGGRTWRSGLSLGTGLLYEGSERAFSTTYRTVTEEQQITSYFVTLNDQVFVSDIDTLTSTTVSENKVSGIYHRALLRVPLELGRRFDVKQWSIMPKAGLLLELNLKRQGLSLDQAGSDGPLVAVKLDPEAMRQRHPDLLLAMVGAEVSYMISERWRMSAAPVFQWTLIPLGAEGTQPRSIPQRSGIEFGLTYTFPGLR